MLEKPPVAATFRSYWRIVALLMLVAAVGHFNRVGMSVAGNRRILEQYHFQPHQMGLVYSAFLCCYTLAMLPGGWFIDRFGARAALFVFLMASSVFVTWTATVGRVFREPLAVWIGLMLVRSLMGISNAPLHPGMARMVGEHVPPGARSRANGLVTLAACVGIAATYYVLGALIDRVDWPAAFLICSALTVVVAGVWLTGTRGAAALAIKPPAAPRLSDMLRLLRSPSVICITLSYAALGFFQYLFFYWIEYYFETVQKQGALARLYSTGIVLAMGLGMACGGWLSDWTAAHFSRHGKKLVPAAGLFAAGAVFELGLLSSDMRLTLAAFAAAAALLGACEGPFWTAVVELGCPHGGTAAAVMNTGGNAGGTLSPYLLPLLGVYFARQFGDGLGWRIGLSVAGVVSILGATLWWGVNLDRDAK